MKAYIPAALRQAVIARASERCEYCRFPQAASFLTFEIEHIIAEKHAGSTVKANLALARPFCDVHSVDDLQLSNALFVYS